MEFKYIEMKYELKHSVDIPNMEVDIELVTLADIEELLEVYLYAFEEGNATFFKHQDERKRVDYFLNELGLPYCLDSICSFKLLKNNEIIGFCFSMEYGTLNMHITCMAVSPPYQGRGYSKFLIDSVVNECHKQGLKTLTLGTEPTIKAYEIYTKYGFKDMEIVTINTEDI